MKTPPQTEFETFLKTPLPEGTPEAEIEKIFLEVLKELEEEIPRPSGSE